MPADYPPFCGSTCGNGLIDECTMRNMSGDNCSTYSRTQELCDGADLRTSCMDVGYYGGTAACSSQCTFDDRGCDACAIACTSHTSGFTWAVAVSGAYVGVVREPTTTGPWALAVLDASLNEVASATIPQPDAITGVPDGWLLARQNTVQHVDRAGVVGTPIQVSPTGGTPTDLEYGAGGRALLLWNQIVAPATPRVWAAIVGPDGTVAVAPFVLFDESTQPEIATATTDGTSFFVAAKGRLVRVAPDGTVSPVVTGFPIEGMNLQGFPVAVSWSGSIGWYVVPNGTVEGSYTAQRFDAAGVQVGAPIAINTGTRVSQLQAYGTGLVGASIESIVSGRSRFSAVRFDAAGTLAASTEIGVTSSTNAIVLPFGSGIVASFYGAGHANFALAAP